MRFMLGACGGDTAWTPAQLSGLVAWWDANDAATLTTSAGRATAIADKSGNGYTISETSSSGPVVTTFSGLGLDCVQFQAGDYLTAASAADWKFLHDGTTAYNIAFVVEMTSGDNPGNTNQIANTNAGSTGSAGIQVFYDDRVAVPANDRAVYAITRAVGGSYVARIQNDNTLDPNSQTLLIFDVDPGAAAGSRLESYSGGDPSYTWANYTNDTDSGAVSTANPGNAFRLGFPTSGALFYFAECFIWTGALDLTNVRQYVSDKYDISAVTP